MWVMAGSPVSIFTGDVSSKISARLAFMNFTGSRSACSLESWSSISPAEAICSALSKSIPEDRVRQFLLKNVKRSKDNEYSWSLNIKTIKYELPNIMEGLKENQNEITGFPILFLKGENSDYIQEEDEMIISQIFTFADIETIPNAGHWLHAEQPEIFIQKLKEFILQ